jgi:hypothetical protein
MSFQASAEEPQEVRNAYNEGYKNALIMAMYCTQFKENRTAKDVFNCIGEKGFGLHKYQNAKD